MTILKLYLIKISGTQYSPIGTIVEDYLVPLTRRHNHLECDGAKYKVADYPDLAFVLRGQFGGTKFPKGLRKFSLYRKWYSRYGTFRVPDLRAATRVLDFRSFV